MRFVKINSKKFHIDSAKIIASGGSAGGHLAAATAIIDGFDDEKDDTTISCRPVALILFNPVIDNGPAGYGYERIGVSFKDFSPLHNIRKNLPSTIFFLGTKDPLIPTETGDYFKKSMERTGNYCELYLYEDRVHGFFNHWFPEDYEDTLEKTVTFLQSQNLIQK